jgi:regulatory protein
MKAPLSLKGRAIALLAQREHSRIELRRKLLRCAQAEAAEGAGAGADSRRPENPEDPDEAAAQAVARVDALIGWLAEHDYFSEARFVESRVHARAARHGNLRIRQELSRHGLAMPPDTARALQDTELQRATEVWRRKFGALPATPAERARQFRFLAARGFSGETIAKVMRLPDPAD